MRRRLGLFALMTTALACGNGSLDPRGQGGTSGAGTSGTTGIAGAAGSAGDAGTTGAAGTTAGAGTGGAAGVTGAAGTAGALPACTASSARDIEVAIVGSDGKLINAATTALVTVSQIDGCGDVTCPVTFPEVPSYPAPSQAAKRIVLAEAGPRQWTLYLRNDRMPDDLIKVGDTFGLTVDARTYTAGFQNVYQAVALSRGPDLIAFARFGDQYWGPMLPDLNAFRVGVEYGGRACVTTDTCTWTGSGAAVTVAGESAIIGPGQTTTVGWLSFTNGIYSTYTCGETWTTTLMAGFRAGTGGSGGGGTGGGGASGAAGSSGGTGGMLPACASNGDSVALAIALWDGAPVASTYSPTAVTVASVERCDAGTCPTYFPWPPAFSADFRMASRIGLTDNKGSSWTLYLRNTAMPPDLIKVGDAFDMFLDGRVEPTSYRTINQTIVLSRDGKPIVFASGLSRFGAPPVPQLEAFGIAVADAGAACENTAAICSDRPHSARVTIGSDSATVPPGQTASIGGFSFTNGSFRQVVDMGSCDEKSATFMAGFQMP